MPLAADNAVWSSERPIQFLAWQAGGHRAASPPHGLNAKHTHARRAIKLHVHSTWRYLKKPGMYGR